MIFHNNYRFPSALQREIQKLLRVYHELRRTAEPVKEEEKVQSQSLKEGDSGDVKANITDAQGQEPSANSTLEETLDDQPVQADVTMEDATANEQPMETVSESSTAIKQASTEPSESSTENIDRQRALLSRFAVLIDEWVQNCEEKVNLTKAAYDSVSLSE